VVLETRHGLLVEALLDAGFTVVPVNPDLVARRRHLVVFPPPGEDALKVRRRHALAVYPEGIASGGLAIPLRHLPRRPATGMLKASHARRAWRLDEEARA